MWQLLLFGLDRSCGTTICRSQGERVLRQDGGPYRSRVSGLRAEEFGDLIYLDHGSTKIGDQTFGFLMVLDCATSHLTAYPCKSTFPSEVTSKLHEQIDTFQMNLKAICADMATHHPTTL